MTSTRKETLKALRKKRKEIDFHEYTSITREESDHLIDLLLEENMQVTTKKKGRKGCK